MTAYEILQELLGLLRQALPQADFRESFAPGPGSRVPERPVVTGQVDGESTAGGKWSGRLAYAVYLPRGCEVAVGEEILTAVSRVAGENFPALSGVERKGFAPDTSSGLLMARCFLEFAGGGEGGGQSVCVGGMDYPASGWEITMEPGRTLTAVGENEPFGTVGGTAWTVKMEGIDTKGLERLAGFTVELGEQIFTRCRWKSLNETGKTAVFQSNHREERGSEDGSL